MVKKKVEDKTLYYIVKGFKFILLSPYYLVKGIYNLAKGSKNIVKKVKIKNKRKAIEAKYNEFKVLKKESGDFYDFEDQIFHADSKIGVILGARGTGKTAFGIKLLENAISKTNKKIYAIGFDPDEMPSWINVEKDITKIKNNSFVLVDEGGILFSSRNSMSNANKLLSELILIARHKSLSILFISQNCLPKNQKVLTPNGSKSLKNLKSRDLVYAYDFEKNKMISTIARKSTIIKKKVVKIHLEDGRILKSSQDHKWIVYNNRGLSEKSAKDLNNSNDYLIDVSNKKNKL